MKIQRRAAVWPTVAFLLGIGVSVAANVAHTWHPSPSVLLAARAAGRTWRPETGAQLMAAFYPVALLLTIEILSRVSWPRTFGWGAARYGGAALVAGVAAVVSYRHMAGLLSAYGEDRLTAAIGPLSVDGLMVVASFALLAVGRSTRDTESTPRAPLPVGPGLEEHPLAGPGSTPLAAPRRPALSRLPGSAFLRQPWLIPLPESALGGTLSAGARPLPTSGSNRPWTAPAGVLRPSGEPVPRAAGGAFESPISVPAPAAPRAARTQLNGDRDVARIALGDRAPEPESTCPSGEDELLPEARELYAEMLLRGNVPPVRAIKRDLKVGWTRASALRDALGGEHAPADAGSSAPGMN